MDSIEYVEKVAQATLDQARSAYDGMVDRVYKLATLVAGGAGAAGVYVLGKLGSASASQVVPAAAISCWWFLIAGASLLHGAKSSALTVGTSSDAVRQRLLRHRAAGAEDDAAALWYTRWDQLAAVDQQIVSFSEAASRRARTLDCAYWCLACSPVIAALAYLLTR